MEISRWIGFPNIPGSSFLAENCSGFLPDYRTLPKTYCKWRRLHTVIVLVVNRCGWETTDVESEEESKFQFYRFNYSCVTFLCTLYITSLYFVVFRQVGETISLVVLPSMLNILRCLDFHKHFVSPISFIKHAGKIYVTYFVVGRSFRWKRKTEDTRGLGGKGQSRMARRERTTMR